MPRKNKNVLNSAISIAKLLNTEGFTDFVANECERYYRRNSVLTDRQKKSLAQVERAFGEMAARLTDTDRIVLGKFIGFQKKLSFDTGLRIGLQVFATKNATDVDIPNGGIQNT